MRQLELTSNTLRDAIEDEIRDAGGWYAVSEALYPAKFNDSPDSAERHLRNSVDPKHKQKLSVYEHQLIKALSKKTKGMCASIVFDCREHDYTTPTPIEPEDEKARLQREIINAADLFNDCVSRLEKLS